MDATTKRILVVDDEKDVCDMFEVKFRKQIKKQELSFLFAHNGEEAVEKLKENPDTSIVLTDLHMPKMDGLKLLEHLQHVKFPGASIVITAYGQTDRARQAMHKGALDVLNKPIDFADLEKTLFRAIQTQEKMAQRVEATELELIQAQSRIIELESQVQDLQIENRVLQMRVDGYKVELEGTASRTANSGELVLA